MFLNDFMILNWKEIFQKPLNIIGTCIYSQYNVDERQL
jgi:hypothetical protein